MRVLLNSDYSLTSESCGSKTELRSPPCPSTYTRIILDNHQKNAFIFSISLNTSEGFLNIWVTNSHVCY